MIFSFVEIEFAMEVDKDHGQGPGFEEYDKVK